ncbi:MAG: Ldh family oxidoreductase [Spirochaetia bacterium]|nr:Ldh family oxidoreductase [Spirochaetia bacterium]MCF7946497.1 Ldh family oxidoreductase [Spirochaetia bacterium]MCF7952486.1 Ldh family oxidoreductase [Spirochaetales bacterium]
MNTKASYITADNLMSYSKNLYAKTGMSDADAEICAECTVKTNLWGVDSHGILRTPVYLERILNGAVKPRPEIQEIENNKKLHSPVSLLDGDKGLGYVVAEKAMEAAVKKAESFGLGFVLVKNSNHFGAASLFSRKAAEKGLIGITATNVMPNIGMPGGKLPVTGNNPIALAAPIGQPYPFSLDISMSAVSGGKILLAQKKGEKIPKNWAVDKNGNPTDDPFEGFAGILLPVGMHKGLGLSLFIDIITGVLSSGPFLQNLKSMYKHAEETSETSHVFIVIDPTLFQSRETYEKRIHEWVRMIKATPMTDPEAEQIIPGEIEYKIEKSRRDNGIPIPAELITDLSSIESRLGSDVHIADLLN